MCFLLNLEPGAKVLEEDLWLSFGDVTIWAQLQGFL